MKDDMELDLTVKQIITLLRHENVTVKASSGESVALLAGSLTSDDLEQIARAIDDIIDSEENEEEDEEEDEDEEIEEDDEEDDDEDDEEEEDEKPDDVKID
jgi:hypothetical protein